MKITIQADVKPTFSKNKINKNQMVKAVKILYDTEQVVVEDKDGNQETYDYDELILFGKIHRENTIFEITKIERRNDIDINFYGYIHLSPNVRSSEQFFSYHDANYIFHLDGYEYYDYSLIPLTNEEVINTLLNDVVYGAEPYLQGSTMIGTGDVGIDKNPNEKDGHYLLNDGKEYYIKIKKKDIEISEILRNKHLNISRKDLIYTGKLDWKRYQEALIKSKIKADLKQSNWILKNEPELTELIYQYTMKNISTNNNYKLSTDK